MKILSFHLDNLPSNKSFGLLFSFIFLLGAIYFYFNYNIGLFIILLLISLIFLFLSYFYSKILYYPNLIWMTLAVILSKIINPIVMSVIFYLIITPTGLVGRLIGRDELRLKKYKTDTYWKSRNSKFNKLKSFKEQF